MDYSTFKTTILFFIAVFVFTHRFEIKILDLENLEEMIQQEYAEMYLL